MLALPLPAAWTILLLTAGTALVYLEFNRPGLILAGIAGLAAWLVGLASLLHAPHRETVGAMLFVGYGLLYRDWRKPRSLLATLAGVVLIGAFVLEIPSPQPAGPVLLAPACAFGTAAGTHWLNRIAFRARRNKGLD